MVQNLQHSGRFIPVLVLGLCHTVHLALRTGSHIQETDGQRWTIQLGFYLRSCDVHTVVTQMTILGNVTIDTMGIQASPLMGQQPPSVGWNPQGVPQGDRTLSPLLG